MKPPATDLSGRCRDCRHWMTDKTLSPVCSEGDVMSEQGPRKLVHESTLGRCAKMVDRMRVAMAHCHDGEYDVVGPLDVVVCDAYRPENQWGRGGVDSPQTGPDFGCIHWEAKRPDKKA